jgi:hypothetical protein
VTRATLLAGVLATAACRTVPDAFTCERDEQCGDEAGRCEPGGACSQADPACASGRRYVEHAAADRAGRCVDEVGEPGDDPDAASGARVVRFALWNADDDVRIDEYDPLEDGTTLPSERHFAIQAITDPEEVGSVEFLVDGDPVWIEGDDPYFFPGNDGDDVAAFSAAPGTYVFTAIPYDGADATGAIGRAHEITLILD